MAGVTTLASASVGAPGTPSSIAAGIGPISAPVPPFSPMLTPARQIAFNAWVTSQTTIPPKQTDSSDLAYQIAVAGKQEYVLPTGTTPGPGSTMAVEGVRSPDGALIEAKNVRQVGCNPRTLVGLQSTDKITGFPSPGDSAELAKYGQVLSNPANSQLATWNWTPTIRRPWVTGSSSPLSRV